MSDVEVIRAAGLDGVPHGFLGRRGGVSVGVHAGLNVGLGSDDDPMAVAENRVLAMRAVLPGATLVTVYQVHGADAVTVRTPPEGRPHADALVTDRPGIALGILTDATVQAMTALGAATERIVAAIGPTIARAAYEVDDAFLRRFAAADPANERFFADGRAGHHRFDLEAYVAHRLAAAGVGRIEALGLDTYADADRFYSYRRATHRGELGYGRQIALIALE